MAFFKKRKAKKAEIKATKAARKAQTLLDLATKLAAEKESARHAAVVARQELLKKRAKKIRIRPGPSSGDKSEGSE